LLFYALGDYNLGTAAVAQLGILNIVLHIINIIYIFKGLLDQYILAILIMQALLTTGPQVIHVCKFEPDKHQRGFYLINLLFTTIEIAVAFRSSTFVDRNEDICSELQDAIITTERERIKCITPFYALCSFLVAFDFTVAIIDRRRNKNLEFRKRRYIRPRWLTWMVTAPWSLKRVLFCLSGSIVWILSVIVLEVFIIGNFHRYVDGLSAGFYSLENEWSYGQSIPFAVALSGILFSLRSWVIQPGRPVKGKPDVRYGEGWLHFAARNWLNAEGVSFVIVCNIQVVPTRNIRMDGREGFHI